MQLLLREEVRLRRWNLQSTVTVPFHVQGLVMITFRLCVKAVTEPDSVESTEITDQALAESTEYNGKLRFSDTGI